MWTTDSQTAKEEEYTKYEIEDRVKRSKRRKTIFLLHSTNDCCLAFALVKNLIFEFQRSLQKTITECRRSEQA